MGIAEKRIFISHLSKNLALQNGNRVREINLIFTQYGSNIRHTPLRTKQSVQWRILPNNGYTVVLKPESYKKIIILTYIRASPFKDNQRS